MTTWTTDGTLKSVDFWWLETAFTFYQIQVTKVTNHCTNNINKRFRAQSKQGVTSDVTNVAKIAKVTSQRWFTTNISKITRVTTINQRTDIKLGGYLKWNKITKFRCVTTKITKVTKSTKQRKNPEFGGRRRKGPHKYNRNSENNEKPENNKNNKLTLNHHKCAKITAITYKNDVKSFS